MSAKKRKDVSIPSAADATASPGSGGDRLVRAFTTEIVRFDGNAVRDRLVEALRFELLGPEHPDEVLRQSPATRYLVGMLAPQGTESDPVEDEEVAALADEAEDPEPPPLATLALTPSSIGLSFVLAPECHRLTVTATWGEYAKRRREEEVAGNDDMDADDETEARKKTPRAQYDWHRTPHSATVEMTSFEEGRSQPISIGDGVHVEWMVRRVAELRVVSVFLVNARQAPAEGRPPDEIWLYQPQLRISGEGAPFLARRLARDHPHDDPDIASADLIYRKRIEFATGHGVAAAWKPSPMDADRAIEIRSEIIPQHEVPIVRPRESQMPEALSMDALATALSGDELAARLSPLLKDYSRWLDECRSDAAGILQPDRVVAEAHIKRIERCLERMRSGIDLLRKDPSVREAFQFANRAMALQRRRSVTVLRVRRGEQIPSQIEAAWRPFQMGFILQCLTGIADPHGEDRNIADLLWFPTGGGKTEAYLGLTAFTLAHRRLRTDPGGADPSAGTGVLMRYTLRLLTLQQFQRAAALLCACEVIRREDPKKWGDTPFTIGLWVGESVTPNNYEDAIEALAKLQRGERVYEGSPYQVLFCPWCGTDLTPRDYASDDDLERIFVRCSNRECDFNIARSPDGLPVLLVDGEIYRHPPALLLATVDKFAQLAWNPRIQALFGRVDRFCPRHGFLTPADDHAARHNETRGWPVADVRPVEARLAPPDLIIQDELHLISGPLGTLVGIYESVVEGLCTRGISDHEIRPKVIASTATIRRASAQIEALFDRKMRIFPPLGLDADDSYFAQEDKTRPGRLYVGVYAPGKSVKTALVRASAAMLSRTRFEFDAVRQEEAELKTEADSYMTLVGYFNSLRELGGALRLVDDDVPARIRVLYKRGFGPNRLIYEVKELTSRKRSSEIAETLKQMDRTFMKVEKGVYPIDVLLASNMLSVGVDIDRLSLMVVSAQPKTSAEYIQATSRVGRVHPGLVIEVYNWVRPRDTSHYERFIHYHDTFYRHVEATSVTPFSMRARDRALPAVFVSWVRQTVMNLAREQEANNFRAVIIDVQQIIERVANRAGRVTESKDVQEQTRQKLKNLAAEWETLTSPRRPVVYTGRGLKASDNTKTVLLSHMEAAHARGRWVAAGSLREVETEVDVILMDEPEGLNGR